MGYGVYDEMGFVGFAMTMSDAMELAEVFGCGECRFEEMDASEASDLVEM